MEQKKITAYQLSLFNTNGANAMCPYPSRETVSLAFGSKALQIASAGEQERALMSKKHSTIYRNRRVRKVRTVV
jgi:hypothetical protein